MKNRLARIFNPATGRTVMLAIDHGYFQGPTTGLERIDLNIVPLAAVRRRADADARHPAHRRSRPTFSNAIVHARQRRPEHPQGTLQRATRHGHRGRHPPERRRDGRPGLHRRRVRDPLGPQHDPAGRHGHCATACRRWPSPPSARTWCATPSISAWPAASAPSSAPTSSRPTTCDEGSRRSPPAARCRSSWPAARSCPSSRR